MRTDRRLDAVIGVGLLVTVAYFVLPGDVLPAAAYLLVGGGSATAIALASRWSTASTARGWRLVALGIALFTLGDAIWYWYELVRHVEVPAASLADVAYLAGYPALAAGIVFLLRARQSNGRFDGIFDGCILALAGSVAVWEGLLEPTIGQGMPLTERLVTTAYPTMDLVLLTAVASLALTDIRALPAYRYLFVGLTMQLAADVAFATSAVSGAYVDGVWFDGGWLLGYLFLGLAALHPSMRRLAEPVEQPSAARFGPVRAMVLGLSLLAGPVALVLEGSGMDPYDGPVILSIFTVATLLVLARLWGLLTGKDRDIEERAHAALHDALTGLPNRVLFLDRLDHALRRSQRSGEGVAVLFLDIDHFKLVNDTAGHAVGDQLLQTVAERLCSAVRGADTVARFAGDEFTVLCEGVHDEVGAAVVADRILEMLAPPVALPELDLHLSASIGIAVAVGGAIEADELLRNADTAMYQAKVRGRACHEVFDHAMRDRAVARLATEDALRRALEEDQLFLEYQPEIALRSGDVYAVEGLLRWAHPERGVVPPLEFLPIAEDSGLIVPIGRWVLHTACAQAQRWQDELGDRAPVMAVNVSARQLTRSDVAADVASALAASGLDPRKLCIEVTESILLEDADAARTTLLRLSELGVSIAMDDFGTGYSSLSHLRELPVDIVKIDRSFVQGLGQSDGDAALVGAVIGMAQALGILTVAEGVETEQQAAWLRSRGCDLAQGYLFARPQPADAVLGAALPA